METYRVLWLSVCVPLGVIGAAVGLVISPAAVAVLFIVVRGRGQPADVLPCRRVLGARHGRSAAAPGRRRAGRWNRRRCLRRVRVPPGSGRPPARSRGPGRLAIRGARLRSLAQIGPHPVGRPAGRCGACLCLRQPRLHSSGRRRNCASSPMSSSVNGGEPATGHLARQQSSAVKLIAARRGAADVPRRARTTERERVRGLAGRRPPDGGDPLPYLTGDHIDAPAVDWDELTRGHGS